MMAKKNVGHVGPDLCSDGGYVYISWSTVVGVYIRINKNEVCIIKCVGIGRRIFVIMRKTKFGGEFVKFTKRIVTKIMIARCKHELHRILIKFGFN